MRDSIRKTITRAIADFDMIRPDDRIMVATSGGKDSTILLLMLEDIRQRAPFSFSIHAVMLDQKQPGFSASAYSTWLQEKHNIPLTIIEEDTFAIVKEKTESGKSYCGLCSRLRRGILYNYAHEHRYSKIALGHHRDDLNETVLLNLFYNGQIASMPPKLLSDDGRNIVIRPLCYVAEDHLTTYAVELQIPVIPCNLCGSQENMARQEMKKLLRELALKTPTIGHNILAAQKNVKPTQLMDRLLHDFSFSIPNEDSKQ